MKLFNFLRKPTPTTTDDTHLADMAEVIRRAKKARTDAKIERELAYAEWKGAIEACNTQRQHKAAKRVRRATDRCLALGV